MDVAIEVKGGGRVHEGDITGVRALAEEHRPRPGRVARAPAAARAARHRGLAL
jgi:hypothetical protein